MRQLFISLFDRTTPRTTPRSGDPSRYHPRSSYKITGSSSRNPYRSFDPSDDLQALQPVPRRGDPTDDKQAHTITMAYPGRAEKGGGGIGGGGGGMNNHSGVVGGQGGSDESVLQTRNITDITKTTEVDVQYQDRAGPNDVDRMV
jgi:hypothetical protein